MNQDPADKKPKARMALPSDLAGAKSRARILFLVAAFLSLVASVILFFSGDENVGIFVGLWVPSILALGALLAPSWRE
jgi:hypothetical protein